MTRTRPGARRRVVGALGAVAALAACALPDAGAPGAATGGPGVRPSDGLLDRPELQRVVDAQVARDTAALLEALADGGARVRARAAFALGSVQAPGRAVDALLEALGDADAAVRRDAAFALGQVGPPRVVDPLARALSGEDDPAVRHRILEALGKVPTPAAAAALVEAEVRPGEEARRVLSLARLGAVAGVAQRAVQDHLLPLLDAADPDVRAHAAYYFGRQPEPGHWSLRASRLREALDAYGPDEPAAMFLVQALGRLGADADEARLLRWLREGADWRTRYEAASYLAGGSLDGEGRTALLSALDDPSPHVAAAAAAALASAPQVASTLREIRGWIGAHPDRWRVAAPLLGLLARHDEREFVLGWIDELPAEDVDRRAAGLAALASLPGDDARDRLFDAARSGDDALAAPALAALGQRFGALDRRDRALTRPYFDLFLQSVDPDRPRAAAVGSVALADTAFRGLGGVQALVDAYRALPGAEAAETRSAVVRALGLTRDATAEPALRDALDDPDPRVRRAAAGGLSALTGTTVRPPDGDDAGPQPDGPDPRVIDWDYLGQLGPAPVLVLETAAGVVRVEMATEEAPHTVQTLARLAEAGRYDGVPFHRVVPNFVVQGGDVAGLGGRGGPGFRITSELTLIPYRRGTAGMASAGKDTEGSQFFLTHVMTPHLDGGYTAFGRVAAGMDVVDRIVQGDRIVSARIGRSP